MIVTSVTACLAGVGVVATAPYVPSRLALLERIGGALLGVGLMAIGVALAQTGG